MDLAIIIIYTFACAVILLYSLSQLNLLLKYLRAKKQNISNELLEIKDPHLVPYVTIQLPIYNEMYVVERLLKNIAEIEYPREKLEIQVLDDSTDESVIKTENLVKELQDKGLDIVHLRRKIRSGFKAGALKEGLKMAKGEFIAVFDSDFLPGKDWLLKTLPHFKDSNTGMVQTRWGHINRDYSMLTRIQAFALDFHFIMEQTGRNFGAHFINFNGTAGIWRKACILDAGNWNGDTLTEDLDLSYRAQMKNWEFKYLENVVTPAELPVVISAAKSQQFRWNKGAAENFQKNFHLLYNDKKQSKATKIHGFFHLLNSSLFFILLLIAVLSIPVLYIKNSNPQFGLYFYFIAGFSISAVIFFICYWITWTRIYGKGVKSFFRFIGMFFAFFSVAMGLSLHNSIAVLEGHLGKKSDFIRTPKFNINNLRDSWKGNIYLSKDLSLKIIPEVLLFLYFVFGVYSAFILKDFGLVLFHLMLVAGFGFIISKELSAKA